MGFRSCHQCGNPAFPHNLAANPGGRELCAHCLAEGLR